MRNYLMIGGVAASLALSSAVAPSWALELNGATFGAPVDVVPDDELIVELVGLNGSGCPLGTAEVAVSEDKKAFTVTYSAYLAQVGVGAAPLDSRKNCQLGVLVHLPSGFTFGITQVDYRGYAHLEPGAQGVLRANHYFAGMPQSVPSTHVLNGGVEGIDEDWVATDQMASTVFLPCGAERYVSLHTSLRVNAGASDPKTTTSFVVMGSADESLSTLYHLTWMTCPVKP